MFVPHPADTARARGNKDLTDLIEDFKRTVILEGDARENKMNSSVTMTAFCSNDNGP
jgi:hypothetical protein